MRKVAQHQKPYRRTSLPFASCDMLLYASHAQLTAARSISKSRWFQELKGLQDDYDGYIAQLKLIPKDKAPSKGTMDTT